MTALTRRRSDNEHQETWQIYFGDVCVGSIGLRAGVPTSADQLARRLLSRHGAGHASIRLGRDVRRGPRCVRGRVAAIGADAH